MKDGRLAYDNNAFGKTVTTITATEPLTPGEQTVEFSYERKDAALWGGGVVKLLVNGKEVGEGVLPQVGPPNFMDAFCIGQECGSAPGDAYAPPYRFTGKIEDVRLDAVGPDLPPPPGPDSPARSIAGS